MNGRFWKMWCINRFLCEWGIFPKPIYPDSQLEIDMETHISTILHLLHQTTKPYSSQNKKEYSLIHASLIHARVLSLCPSYRPLLWYNLAHILFDVRWGFGAQSRNSSTYAIFFRKKMLKSNHHTLVQSDVIYKRFNEVAQQLVNLVFWVRVLLVISIN